MKTRIVQDEPNDPASAGASGTSTIQTVEATGSSVTTPTNGFRAFVRRRELVIFFVLSYLIAWSTLPFGSFLAFSPLFSAIIVVTIAEGWRGLAQVGRRLIRWRVNWIWYAAAIGLPLLVHALAIGLNMAAGAPAPSLAQFQPWYAVLMVFGLSMVNPLEGPLGEEPAWRGFAQPRLQSKWSPLASAALLAVLITSWHLPLVFMPQFDLGLPDIATTVLVTFWYAWLFNRSGGSVLLPLIAHVTEGCVNIHRLWPAGPFTDRQSWTWLIATGLLVLALLIFDRKSWRTAPESAIDRVPGRIS
ncbi:MAG TPA: CPBP family glutamic-type intramembrane protease [Propionibacteriaceae bacterium]|nr:CPBP family glutamic-type intramembrane protease [Propionibacteriaceae bacterium]